MKELGATLLILGFLLMLAAWGTKKDDMFLFEIIFGPILIYYGLKLLK
jgi:hypothetical protein